MTRAATYISSKPCRRGHDLQRYVRSRGCVACARVQYERDRTATILRARTHYEKNKITTLARISAWGAENRDRVRTAKRRWGARNADYMRAAVRNHRAKLASAPGSHTAAEVAVIFLAQGHNCAACGIHGKLTVDHIVPVARGGSNGADNLQGLCGSCNSAKCDRDNDAFMARRRAA